MIDSANVFKAAYLRRVNAVWPMTSPRLASIYGTVKRALRSAADRQPMFEQLLASASDWESRCEVILQTPDSFDSWFFHQLEAVTRVPFSWEQAPRGGRTIKHEHLSFGAAQKFLNLIVKDWWAKSPRAASLDAFCGNLHAPLDDLVVSFLTRARPQPAPESLVYDLERATYMKLQYALDQLGDDLHGLLRCARKPVRIEVEQLVWGWIG